jgi:hypothetical protein
MKPMPDARENRRLAEIENGKAEKLPPGAEKAIHLQKADELEASARSSDWRRSDLHPPK